MSGVSLDIPDVPGNPFLCAAYSSGRVHQQEGLKEKLLSFLDFQSAWYFCGEGF